MNIYIYVYTLFLFFSIIFLFDASKIKTLNNIKIFYKNAFISIAIVMVFLSMSGVPPLAGFIGKFMLFNFLFFFKKYLCIVVFSFLNFFSIYFYIQNLRFLISTKYVSGVFLIRNFYAFFNKKLITFIVFLNLLNFYSILFIEDFYYYFLNFIAYKYV